MQRWLSFGLVGLALVFAYACAGTSGSADSSTTGSTSANGGAGGSMTGQGTGGSGFKGAGGGTGGGMNCEPPDMLIVLDRTMSMHRQPNGTPAVDTPGGLKESKWWIAVEAVEVATATYSQGIRFGLELFPKDPGNGACVTLQQRISGTTATNPNCQQGEVLVEPDLSTSAAIDMAIDPLTSVLCKSTPIAKGLETTSAALLALEQGSNTEREQYALLITDGQDTCSALDALQEVQAMAAAEVKTYVVGFHASGGTGVDVPQLNNMACGGHTATDFANNCVDDGQGNYSWDSLALPIVYIVAEGADSLNVALTNIAAEVCCDCID
jgi:hypothetical protein